MAAANLLFMGFLYSPEAFTRPVRALFRSSRPVNGALHQVSRRVSDTSVSATTESTFSRNTSCGQESLLDGLSQHDKQDIDSTISLGPAASNAFASLTHGPVSPKQRISPKKASPSKTPSAKTSPTKSSANGVSGPPTPRTLETDSVESEADLRQKLQALKALADQHDGLASDLKVIQVQMCFLCGLGMLCLFLSILSAGF